MPNGSIRERLVKLEGKRQFLDWFLLHRFHATLRSEEIQILESGEAVPDSLLNRPSPVDSLDRKSIIKLWEENERIFSGRSHEQLEFLNKTGFWPEQKGHFHYSTHVGKIVVKWRHDTDEAC
jgi:hypothetical protein